MMERGVPSRSISRSLAVLQAINRHDSLSVMQVSKICELPYVTANRMVLALMHEKLIECGSSRKSYRVTALVNTLSDGYSNPDGLVESARPFIVALTRKHGWPVVITSRVEKVMMVRDTTQDLTSLTHHLYPAGYTTPILESSAGCLSLAYMSDDQRRRALDALEESSASRLSLSGLRDARVIARIRKDGFTIRDGSSIADDPCMTSSISVPILRGQEAAGALTLLFFTAFREMADALGRYVPDLGTTARLIGHDLQALNTSSM